MPTGRSWGCAVEFQGIIYVIGGRTTLYSNEGSETEELIMQSDAYKELASMFAQEVDAEKTGAHVIKGRLKE